MENLQKSSLRNLTDWISACQTWEFGDGPACFKYPKNPSVPSIAKKTFQNSRKLRTVESISVCKQEIRWVMSFCFLGRGVNFKA